MFSKEERKAIHTSFWKRFKSKATQHKNAEGKRINWLNYPTKLKQIYIRLHADNNLARFSIEIQDKDPGIRDLIWEQFEELKKVLENEMPATGVWNKNAFNAANQPIYRISWEIENVNMYDRKDEEKIFNFFIDHLHGFDRFYVDFREVLFGLLK
tara:strand:- start:18593 stop:19057 length:465 start_codon:yes stop_codon:yes gene_type:complete